MTDFLTAIADHLNRTPTLCACGHPSVLHSGGWGCTARWEHDSGSDLCACGLAPMVLNPEERDLILAVRREQQRRDATPPTEDMEDPNDTAMAQWSLDHPDGEIPDAEAQAMDEYAALRETEER